METEQTLKQRRVETHHQNSMQRIASAVEARARCARSDNKEWFERWTERLEEMAGFLPSGSGFDCGTKIDWDASRHDKVVFHTSFHHMDEGGGYDGWTEHTVTARPAFDGFVLTVGGRDRNGIKEYIGEMFHNDLSQRIEVTENGYSRAA